jgi:hypothetical protein
MEIYYKWHYCYDEFSHISIKAGKEIDVCKGIFILLKRTVKAPEHHLWISDIARYRTV